MLARVKDWLIGAAATVLLLVVAVVVLFVAVSEPADPSPGPASAPSPAVPGRGDAQPPADLGEDEIWYASAVLTSERLLTAGSPLRDVRAVGEDVVTGPDGLVAARVVLDGTVPFGVVAQELGDDTTVGWAGEDEARVLRTVEVAGRELRVAATGTVEVDDGTLVVVPRSIDLGGPDRLGDALADLVRGLVTITHDVQGLPEGLRLEEVAIQDDGFRVHLQGEDLRLLP